MQDEQQVKSRQRVQAHGEVFTAQREVNAMLDLVKQETERIDSRFLEPACGNGNFLIEVLRRKLAVVKGRYKPSISRGQTSYEKNALLSISSIYGVDLLEDNAQECRDRLFGLFFDEYSRVSKELNEDILKSARYILSLNIICGDALTMRDSAGEAITFAQWDIVGKIKIKRVDYTLAHLLEAQENQTNMFASSLGMDLAPDLVYDENTKSFIPKPIKEFPPIAYWEVYRYDEP